MKNVNNEIIELHIKEAALRARKNEVLVCVNPEKGLYAYVPPKDLTIKDGITINDLIKDNLKMKKEIESLKALIIKNNESYQKALKLLASKVDAGNIF